MINAVMMRIIPKRVKLWLAAEVQLIASRAQPPISALKFIPYSQGTESYLIPKRPQWANDICDSGLAIPPKEFWGGYGSTKEEYLSFGEAHVRKMIELVEATGFSIARGNRILDFGCSSGRMIRHLRQLSETCEVWGTDISARHIYWAKQHLSPPFRFATTTTIPHLPFEDRFFDFIYCGSVFTHIDDLAEAWLCELRRILSPAGRIYLTIHDKHTIELLDGPYRDHSLAKEVRAWDLYTSSKDILGMLVLGRDTESQVFYDIEYFQGTLRSMGFRTLSVVQEAYGYQTAVLVERA